MPDSSTSPLEVRCSALEEFLRIKAPEPCKTRCPDRRTPSIPINGGNADGDHLKGRKRQADVQPLPASDGNGSTTKHRGRGVRINPKQGITANDDPPTQPPSRKPGSSIYYGVRFRPDLNKWVAEIRVAEWKVVDKKVWLGTFDTEEGAARGVDLARKLLKCAKKHPYNLPCDKLDAYSGQIPSHLVLTDVTTNSMFKAATNFIKGECQVYAASFDSPTVMPATLTPNLPGSQFHFQQTSPPFHSTRNIDHILAYETDSIDSEILDVANDYSDTESCIPVMSDYIYANSLPDDITINDYYINDPFSFDHTTMQTTTQLGSSPSSSTSTTSCITFDQRYQDIAEWEMSSAPTSLPIPGFPQGSSIVATTVQGAMAMEMEVAGSVSHEFWADSLQQRTWPGPPISPSTAFSVTLPDSNCGMTPYMSYVDGGYITPMECDDWSFQGVHFPFQYGSNGWC